MLQCRCPVSPFKKTVHIVAHYAKASEEDVGRHLFNFVVSHRAWISQVGGKILAKKKLDLEEYLSNLYLCLTPVDQLGLLILAHLYHRHFVAFLKNGVWTTRKNNSMENCKIYFEYKGGYLFSDTVQTDIPSPLNLSLEESPKAVAHTSPPPIVRTPSPVAEENNSDSDSASESSKLPIQSKLVEEISDSPPPKRKRYTVITCYRTPLSRGKVALGKLALVQANREKERQLVAHTKEYLAKKASELHIVPKTDISDAELRLLCLQNRYNLKPFSIVLEQCNVAKELNKLPRNMSEIEGNKEDLIGTDNNANKEDLIASEDNNAYKEDLIASDNNANKEDFIGTDNNANKEDLIASDDNNANKADSTQSESIANRTRSAKPKNSLKEPDPLLTPFQENNPEEVAELLQEDGMKVKGTCIIGQEELNTHEGEINIKTYGIWHRKKQKKNLQCPDRECNQVFDFVKDMNAHVTEQHPDVRFRCQYCPKSYNTYNGRYKHEHKHFELPYCCHYCSMRFLFPGLREKHECQHTQKGLLPCTWPQCKQMLSCKDALWQHINTHTEERHRCEKCPKDFNTLSNLRQHEKGAHGEGYVSQCGAAFDWSDSRNEHQVNCTECTAKKNEQLHRPKYPHTRRQWKKSIAKDQATKYFWRNDNQLDEFYRDITFDESASCSPLKYVLHIARYQHVLFRAKALFSPL